MLKLKQGTFKMKKILLLQFFSVYHVFQHLLLIQLKVMLILLLRSTRTHSSKKLSLAAYQELDRLAKAGNAQALYNLGYLTQTGQGTAKDDKKALKYYQDASAKGYPVASYVLAQSYAVGQLGLAKMKRKFVNT
jgi:TPR repeat protein